VVSLDLDQFAVLRNRPSAEQLGSRNCRSPQEEHRARSGSDGRRGGGRVSRADATDIEDKPSGRETIGHDVWAIRPPIDFP
jgi:hypothetical protein